jgi:hypothetical protein
MDSNADDYTDLQYQSGTAGEERLLQHCAACALSGTLAGTAMWPTARPSAAHLSQKQRHKIKPIVRLSAAIDTATLLLASCSV